jgi:GH15 family glucan-1,4-alpha-glucosidase
VLRQKWDQRRCGEHLFSFWPRLAANKEGNRWQAKWLLTQYRCTIELTLQYITAFWQWPNFDCWEEHPDDVHPSTLACLYGGLTAIGCFEGREELLAAGADMKRFLQEHCVAEGRFVKSVVHRDGAWRAALPGVDVSLMWLTVPFGVFPPEEPLMKATLERIRGDLFADGGMHRYKEDSYYGGGAWLLLTAWYG